MDGLAPREPPNQARARPTYKGRLQVCRHKRTDVHAIYRLIAATQGELPVAAMCDGLHISQSVYYDGHGRAPSKRTAANVALSAHMEAAYSKSDATCGMPRMRAEKIKTTAACLAPLDDCASAEDCRWLGHRQSIGLQPQTHRSTALRKQRSSPSSAPRLSWANRPHR
jgi:hypothetical protein